MRMKLIKNAINRILKRYPNATELRKKGMRIGENFDMYNVSFDNGHPYLISIGNNVTLTNCRILTHDGTTKKPLGYSRIGRVEIGNNVFVGAGAIILPNVRIGNDVIIGAGCVVAKDVPEDSVMVGNPARKIGSYRDYLERNRELIKNSPVYETHWKDKTEKEKMQQYEDLKNGGYGFDV